MRILINEKISEHKFKTPEGYLICTDAILARTGKQQYTRDEAFGDGSDEIIDIDRPYEEVFSDKTLASFENKPITIEHPEEDVNIDNYKDYAVGFIRDVHKGDVDGNPVMLGNLVITDKEAIEKIESGEMTELSCGYDCDIKDDNGQYHFNNIRGNHLALCKEGRAGIARIVDSKIKDMAHFDMSEDDWDEITNNGDDESWIVNHYDITIKREWGRVKVATTGSRKDLEKFYNDYRLRDYNVKIIDSKARDSKIERVPPELLLSASEWLEDKIYIERKYHVKIYNITSNKGLTVTGNRQDLEKLYKDYHLKDYYGLKVVDSKVKDAIPDSLKEALRKLGKSFKDLKDDNIYNRVREYIENKYGEKEFDKVYDYLENYINKHGSYEDSYENDCSKEMTMSDALRMLNIVDAYKKVNHDSKQTTRKAKHR